MKLSELHESIKAVKPTLPLIVIGTEACRRPEGQAAVMVHIEGLQITLTAVVFLADSHTLAKCPRLEQLWQTASRAGQDVRLACTNPPQK